MTLFSGIAFWATSLGVLGSCSVGNHFRGPLGTHSSLSITFLYRSPQKGHNAPDVVRWGQVKVNDDLLTVCLCHCQDTVLPFLPPSLPVSPQPLPWWGISTSHRQYFVSVLAEFHGIPLGVFLQPVEASLNGSPALKHMDSMPQFGVVHKLGGASSLL